MKHDLDIDELMTETWLVITLLKQGATTLDGIELYDRCVKQVEHVREVLARAGYDEASIGHISYAQCALLDEAVMSRKTAVLDEDEAPSVDEGKIAWRKAPLQARFFGTLHAGEGLWERIADVLKQPSPVMAVLICYHRVLALGFQGLYGVQAVSQSQREAIFRALSERVSPPDAGLTLVIDRTRKRRYRLIRSVWFLVVLMAVITASLWWWGHLWLQALLSSQLPELLR